MRCRFCRSLSIVIILCYSAIANGACILPSCVASDPKLDQVISAISGGGGGSTNVATWNGSTINLGIGNTGTGTLRTVLANDQPPIFVKQSGIWNITDISGTISLPTGASTLALQTAGNTSLSTISSNMDVALSTRTKPSDQQHTIIDSGTVAVTGSFTTTDTTASGTISALNGAVTSGTLNGARVVGIEYNGTTGSFVGTIAVQISIDGTTWREVGELQDIDSSFPFASGVGQFPGNATRHLLASISGAQKVRVIAVAYTSGTASLSIRVSPANPFDSGNATLFRSIDSNLNGVNANTSNTVSGLDAVNSTLGSMNNIMENLLQEGGSVVVTSAPTTAVTGTFWQTTQPVSGTVTANAGTNLNTSLLAIESGGNLASIKTDVDKIPSQGLAATSASSPISLSKDAIVDCSGTIATGGTSQTVRAANSSDKSIEIYNQNSSEQLCFTYGSTASESATGNYCIPPLGYYSNTINNQIVSGVATTTGHKYACTVRQ